MLTSYIIEWGVPIVVAGICAWLLIILGIHLGRQKVNKAHIQHQAIISNEESLEPLKLIDSFPKDNEAITTEDIKKIYLKFNKPIDRNTEGYIQNYFIRAHSRCQWNIGGWIQYDEGDTKLIWHVHERTLQNQNQYGPTDIDYPTFEIRIGFPEKDSRLKATDSSKLPETVIKVKIKPESSVE